MTHFHFLGSFTVWGWLSAGQRAFVCRQLTWPPPVNFVIGDLTLKCPLRKSRAPPMVFNTLKKRLKIASSSPHPGGKQALSLSLSFLHILLLLQNSPRLLHGLNATTTSPTTHRICSKWPFSLQYDVCLLLNWQATLKMIHCKNNSDTLKVYKIFWKTYFVALLNERASGIEDGLQLPLSNYTISH